MVLLTLKGRHFTLAFSEGAEVIVPCLADWEAHWSKNPEPANPAKPEIAPLLPPAAED